MRTIEKDRILQMRGEDVHDSDGDKIGSIEEIYVDHETGTPEWALVSTGMFGGSTFVPLCDASETGGSLRVPYEKAQVKDAPKPDADGDLSEREEADLYRHYGLGPASRRRAATSPAPPPTTR
jgi:sporulation protein YlmC with PRC-barrel domain